MKKIWFVSSALFFVLLCAGALAFGQNDRATITGTLSDPRGAVIPGGRVLATNTDTDTGYTGTTNSDGIYTIPGLPVGTYALKVSQPGFEAFVQTDIILIAAQVLRLDVHLVVGAASETVTVPGGVPLLETETTSVQMTMEESALKDLPLNATGGRDAMNLLLQTTPMVSTAAGGQSTFGVVNNGAIYGGQVNETNSVYFDGLESTAGFQGAAATPGLDALSEVQLITSPDDAEFGTAGGVEMFQIKSGTNKIHGSAFEFLQNEDLNANSWANNYFLAQCAPSDAACRAANSRGFDRFNDYGASAGGPIWKNHTFVFGAFEEYRYRDYQLNPNSVTVPTPQMLTGDFSQLLTGGAQQGIIPGPNGGPWINPCTGQPYEYGQIFDPETQMVVNGATCATPFSGNIIPPGRLSATSKQIAAIYSKYYTPTLSTRIYNNFPSEVSGSPYEDKFTLDLKLDHTFSSRHHLSAGLDHVSWREMGPANSGLAYGLNAGPLTNDDWFFFPNTEYRIVDTFSLAPTLLNTVAVGFGEEHANLGPENPVNPANYGIPGPTTSYFPRILYDGQSGNVANGVLESDIGTNYLGVYNFNDYQFQDTVQWSRGRHNIKFGGTLKAPELNSTWGSNLQTLNFYGDTGGPIDPGLTPYVGFAFANQMLGDVQSSSIAVKNNSYPRQKEYALFFQDDYKVTQKLTLNLGLRWDVTGRLYEKFGHLQNFDLTAQNPNWAPYFGAWAFSKNSGTSFDANEDYLQFGPHLGAAYRVTDKLVARASYGLFYDPDMMLNATIGGYGSGFAATQTSLSFPVNEVTNNTPGSVGFNWDNGYPGVNTLPPQNSTATFIPTFDIPIFVHPDVLKLATTQTFYVGTEYSITNSVVLDLTYAGNRARNLHDTARSIYRNFPSYGDYSPLLQSGHVNDPISNAAQAAADNVPYPFPGFSGPAYAAISPYPQLASIGGIVQATGDPTDGAVTAYNAFVAEVKARNYHGLYLDFNYTLSKMTGSYVGLSGWANNWVDYAQNLDELNDEKHWVQYLDQRHLVKGYLTYQLPFGKGKAWMSGVSALMNQAVGGWELGYYGAYGSGFPMALISSPYQVPFFFNAPYSGIDRASFAPGLNARDMGNHFSGHLNLLNVTDPSNTDFNPNYFTSTSAAAPFGNTPFTFNHWRWNSQPAQENVSVLKHLDIAGERIKMTIGAQFFDVFNRHYYGAPGTALGTPYFGQVTSVTGYRYGQLNARLEW